MNPVHLVIPPTFLAANDDRDALLFGRGRYTRNFKQWVRWGRGPAHVAHGYQLALGRTGLWHIPTDAR